MGRFATFALALCLVSGGLITSSAAQTIKPYDKDAEKAKYHSSAVRGMSAAAREAAYVRRLKLEAESPFGGILWRNVGPTSQGGRVMHVASPANKPGEVIVAFATGGLFKTVDDGQTFTSIWENQSAFGIGDFAVSKDGKTLYVGTGEANNQRTSYSGTGLFKSSDGGKTWQNVGLPESHHIAKVTIDPKDENTVWVSAMGHLYSQNSERGLYKTTDGGKTWNLVLKKDEYTGATDVVLDPKNSKIAVAALYDRDRRAWNFRESGPGSGLYRTEDGGKSWKLVPGLPVGSPLGRVGLSWSESNPKMVLAYVDNQGKNEDWLKDDERVASGRMTARRFYQLDEDMFLTVDKKPLETYWDSVAPKDFKLDDALAQVKDKKLTMKEIRAKIETKTPGAFEFGQNGDELYRSDDGGKTFRLIQKFGSVGGYYYERVFINPKDADDIWICGVPMLRSRDGGKTWGDGTPGNVHVDHHAVHFDTRNPGMVWVGNDGGLYLTRNDGKSWWHSENMSVGQSTTVAVDNKVPYNVYTGLQDNGTMRGPSTFIPGVSDPTQWQDIAGGDGSAIAIDLREDLDLVYVASQFGAHSAFEQKTGKRYNARPRGPAGEEVRANWISPIIISSHHNDIVYVGFNRLYRSFDRGKSYKPISPDLTRKREVGDVPHSSLKDISESPLKFGLIYCGSDDGRVTMTPDGGHQWIDINTPTPEKWVSRIVASRHDEGTVYVSQSGYREDDWSAYLYKSTDYGKTWTSIVGNLPAETINVVREDPKNKDILYVGTDMGVYITFDGGVNWESLHGGLGHLPVHDMVIQERENDLVIATHARGCAILNLKQVHSITPEIRQKDLTLFPVSDMVRGNNWGYERIDRYEVAPANVPSVKLSFYAKKGDKATLQIVSKDGKVLIEKTVDAFTGFNNTSIDLRLTEAKKVDEKLNPPKTGADALKDPYEGFRATFLPKGDYKIVVKVGGATAERAWKLD